MDSKTTFLLALSCGLPLLAFVAARKRGGKTFYSLLTVFLIAFFTELLMGANLFYFHIRDFGYYTYSLACIGYLFFYCQFFYAIGIIQKKKTIFIVNGLFTIFVFINWILFFQQEHFFNFFREGLVYAIIVLYFSIELLSQQVFRTYKAPLENPLAWIASGGILFHVFFIFIVSLMLLKTKDGNFINAVFDIQKIINVLCYLFYTIAVLCIPKTGKYIR